MGQVFTIGEETLHVVGDRQCPECPDEYPEPCLCGGLTHAARGEQDADGTEWPMTRCDACGLPEEEVD